MTATTSDVSRLRSLRVWSFVHTWTSLVSMVFLLMLCVTGLPLVFHEELNEALGYEPKVPVMARGTPFVSLDEVVATAKMSKPDKVVAFVSFEDEQPNTAVVGLAKTLQSTTYDAFLSIDRRTAKVLQDEKPGAGPINFLLQLHTDMFMGLPGKLFLGVMALLFVAAIVSGIVLYGPFMRKLDFGTVRRGRTTRIKWLDWHNLIGAATIAWVLVVGITGTINTWADLMLKLWQFGQLAEMTAPYRDVPRPEKLASLQNAMDTAQAAAGAMKPRFVAYPGTLFSSNNHYAVFMAGDTPLTSRVLKPALIDASNGKLTDMRAMPWYIQALFLSQPLHFGNYGGLALKIVWALLDAATIMVLGSGLYLWLARRRASVPRVAPVAGEAHTAAAPAE